jgi:GAF domain-containing protein
MADQDVLTRTFVELADTLVDDFDVVDLLTLLTDRCVEAFDVGAAGIMLAPPSGGELRVMASSSPTMRDLELYELQSREGPCLDCYRSGEPVAHEELAPGGRWPAFTPLALEAGFRAVSAVPLRLRGVTIGALNLFRATSGPLAPADLSAARAFADVATIAILQHRAVSDAQRVNEQLSHALTSRVVLEQAKGMLAERAGLEVGEAFEWLRGYARNHNLQLGVVAERVLGGTLTVDALRPPGHGRP